jgi:hypothetical protein
VRTWGAAMLRPYMNVAGGGNCASLERPVEQASGTMLRIEAVLTKKAGRSFGASKKRRQGGGVI